MVPLSKEEDDEYCQGKATVYKFVSSARCAWQEAATILVGGFAVSDVRHFNLQILMKIFIYYCHSRNIDRNKVSFVTVCGDRNRKNFMEFLDADFVSNTSSERTIYRFRLGGAWD